MLVLLVFVHLCKISQQVRYYSSIQVFCQNYCGVIMTVRVMVLMFNTTFNTISVISWRSVLLVDETGEPRDNHRPATSHWQTLSHNVVSSTPRLSRIRTHNISARIKLTTLVLVWTNYKGRCKFNYHTNTALTALEM